MNIPLHKHPTVFIKENGSPVPFEYHLKLDVTTACKFKGHIQLAVINDQFVARDLFYVTTDNEFLYAVGSGAMLKTDLDTPVYICLTDYDLVIKQYESYRADLYKLIMNH